MQFESDTQSHCFQAVGQALRQSFPSVVTDAHQPNYLLWQGSAMVEVQVRVFRGEICRIVARSLLIEKVRLTSGLMGWLLEQSELLEIGRFGTTDTDGITLSTSFLSCGPLDATALVASVHAILAQSDAYDDRIHDRWGGTRALDRQRQTRSRRVLASGVLKPMDIVAQSEQTATGLQIIIGPNDD